MLLGILDAPVLCISKDIVKDCEQIIRKLPSMLSALFSVRRFIQTFVVGKKLPSRATLK